ncbi:metal ABC transporter substrate-binding protein [Viridibacterium curvum]|uniref:Zinc ABC transporter substrate-binding protein n=1 Tax=Viridibacterium curvum TaxID=1101404 RepID=A0ABP9R0Y0_9RHOO
MMRWLILAVCASFSLSAQAGLRAVACEPEWGALLGELGGDKVSIYTATTAQQDPHHIQARPSLIAAVRNADLLVCTGAELETGWLPLLLRQSGNAAVQPGKPGYLEAAALVQRLEVPTRFDRADGDVHAAGNPHIHLDARNILLVAEAVSQRLVTLDAGNAGVYQSRLADFSRRWRSAMQRWEREATPLRGVAIVVHHRDLAYLQNWLGLREVGTLEPKPGVEPSSAHLAGLLASLPTQRPQLIVRAAYNDGRAAEWLSARARLPVAVLPFTVGGSPRAGDLFALFDDTIATLLTALR